MRFLRFSVIFWEKILWEGESPYNGKVKVIESSGMRRLVAQSYIQSRSLSKDGKTGFYWDGFLENLPQLSQDSKILILGVGAGTSAKLLISKIGPISIHGVEIDPLIVELGKKYFYLSEPNLKVFISDAEDFVNKTSDKYNAVWIDLFHGSKTPNFITSEVFLEKVRGILEEGGVVIANKICKDDREDRFFVSSFKKIFKDVLVSRDRGEKYEQNIIIYCRG